MTPETQQLSGALTKTQRARVAALIAAADVLAQRGPVSRGALAGADLIQVAEYVIDGAALQSVPPASSYNIHNPEGVQS